MKFDSTVRVLQWCLRRGADMITCAIELRPHDHAFNVVTIPHSDPLKYATERFSGAAAALQRHAAIVRDLREHGWQLATYTA